MARYKPKRAFFDDVVYFYNFPRVLQLQWGKINGVVYINYPHHGYPGRGNFTYLPVAFNPAGKVGKFGVTGYSHDS